MASNLIPTAAKLRSQLAGKMISGINKKGASVPLTFVTETKMQTDLTAFNRAEIDFGKARQTLKDAQTTLIPAAQALLDFLNVARPALIGHYGYFWTADWAAAGFVNNSTAIPGSIEERLGLAAGLVSFFTANPSFEIASTGATAANGETIYQAAEAAQEGVADAQAALDDAETVRKPATVTLLADMRGVIKNLEAALSKSDPRWLAFGLQIPAMNTTPRKPTGMAAQLDPATGGVFLSCDTQPFGYRFRWRGRVAGSGLPFELMARSTQPLGLTKPVAPGTALEFVVQAVNGSAQSVPSDSIFFTVPPVGVRAAAGPVPEVASLTVTDAGSNGNGKTNGNGSRAVATRLS